LTLTVKLLKNEFENCLTYTKSWKSLNWVWWVKAI